MKNEMKGTRGDRGQRLWGPVVPLFALFAVVACHVVRPDLPARGTGPQSARVLAAAGGVAASSAAPSVPSTPVVASAPPPATPAPVLSPRVTVAARDALPANLAIDGDIAEWGALEAVATPPAKDAPAVGSAPATDAPPVERAPSHVVVVLTGEGLMVAGELAELAKDGIWLRIAFEAPALESIMYGRTGTWWIPVDCDPARTDGNAINACRRMLAGFQSKFSKTFRIDRDGMRSATSDAIDGARATFHTTASSTTFEASLPALALPRASLAPVERVMSSAIALSEPAPTEESPGDSFTLAPVSFAPYAKVREYVFRNFASHNGMSYQPGDAMTVEFAHTAMMSSDLEVKVAALFTHLESLGDLEVSSLLDDVAIAVLRGDSLIGTTPTGVKPTAIRRHGADVHIVILANESQYPGSWSPAWRVLAINADGRIQDRMKPSPDAKEFSATDTFADEKFENFGLRGTREIPVLGALRTTVDWEIAWRLDRDGFYKPRSRKITKPPAPRPVPATAPKTRTTPTPPKRRKR